MIKLVVDQIKRLYQDLTMDSFKEPDSDVAKRIMSLYSKINYDETIDNIKTIMKFSSYYPDLTVIKSQEDYKIIDAQNYFYQMSLVLLLKVRYQTRFISNNEEKSVNESDALRNLKGSDLPDEKFKGHILFSPENHKLFQIGYFMEKGKTSSKRSMYVRRLNENFDLDDWETIEFNDLDFYIDLGKLN